MVHIIVCVECNNTRPMMAHNLCGPCYSRRYRQANSPKRSFRECDECHQMRPFAGRGLCITCYQRKGRRENPERQRRNQRNWREANRERHLLNRKRWRAANADKIHASQRRWAATHLEAKVLIEQRRRANKRSVIATLTREQWRAIQTAYKNRCAYCQKESQHLTQDHIIPLSKGGYHTVTNVVPACISCNSRKRDKSPLRPVQIVLL